MRLTAWPCLPRGKAASDNTVQLAQWLLGCTVHSSCNLLRSTGQACISTVACVGSLAGTRDHPHFSLRQRLILWVIPMDQVLPSSILFGVMPDYLYYVHIARDSPHPPDDIL